MKQILCSPTEPKSLVRELGRTSSKPEKHGVDFMWLADKKWYGVQRKLYPNDLEASLNDGRLAKELGQIASIDQAFLVLEGYGQWTTDGEPMGRYDKLTKEGMFSLLTSISLLYDMPTYRVRDQAETVEMIRAVKKWTESPDHQNGRSSLDRRPSSPRNKWGTKDSKTWQVHFLQGFDGIGPVQARSIVDQFGGIPLVWALEGQEAFEEISGIGPKTAQRLWEALS